jgi:hypothetical protein
MHRTSADDSPHRQDCHTISTCTCQRAERNYFHSKIPSWNDSGWYL